MSFIDDSINHMNNLPPGNSALETVRNRGRALWQNQIWPGKKTESWRYTSLQKLERSGVFDQRVPSPKCKDINSAIADTLESSGVNTMAESLNAHLLVFVDGVYQAEFSSSAASDSLPKGLSLTRFSEAKGSIVEKLVNKIGSIVDTEKHLFTAYSESALAEGVFLQVDSQAQIESPVYLLHVSTGAHTQVQARLFVEVETNAQLTLIEHFIGLDSSGDSLPCFNNACTEIELAAGANVKHYRLNMEAETDFHIGGVHASLKNNANLDSFYLALGSQLTRMDVSVKHSGEGAHTNMNGVYLPRSTQHIDFQTCLEHCVPNTSSTEVFRGIVGDSGRAVFNGRIHILPDAQKTNAQLSNKNLLTSKNAEVDTKPELEIYANDVQCAHGATIAELNDESLHYLRTRGISEEEARVILSFGFINELIDKLPHQPIAEFLRPILAKRFSTNAELTRHLG